MSPVTRPAARAVVFDEPGGPDVLRVTELPVPEPAADEVRVRVTAAAVHPADIAFRRGARNSPTAGPHVPGMAISGVVECSDEASAWNVGDRVMGMTLPSSEYGGGYRATVIAPSDSKLGTHPAIPESGHRLDGPVVSLAGIESPTGE